MSKIKSGLPKIAKLRNLPEAKANAQKALSVAGTQLKGIAIEALFVIGLAQTFSGSRQGVASCQQAVATARESNDPDLLSQSLFALAEAQSLTGDNTRALSNAMEAQQIFARLNCHDQEWLAWLLAARSSNKLDDRDKAREYAAHAHDLLNGLQQQWGSDNYNSYLSRPDIAAELKQLDEILSNKP